MAPPLPETPPLCITGGTLPWDAHEFAPSLRTYFQTWMFVVFHPREFGRRMSPAPNVDRAYEYATSTYLLGSTAATGLVVGVLLVTQLLSAPPFGAASQGASFICCGWVALLIWSLIVGSLFDALQARLLRRWAQPRNIVDARRFWSACIAYTSSYYFVTVMGIAVTISAPIISDAHGSRWGVAVGFSGLCAVAGALVLNAVGISCIVATRSAEPRRDWRIGLAVWLIAVLVLASAVAVALGGLLLISAGCSHGGW